MNIEFVGTPISKSCGNMTAVIVQAKVTRDDGSSDTCLCRAIELRLGDLTVKAGLSVVAGETNLHLTTINTHNELPNGQLEKEVHSAVQTVQGDLIAGPGEQMVVTPRYISSLEDMAAFITELITEELQKVEPG